MHYQKNMLKWSNTFSQLKPIFFFCSASSGLCFFWGIKHMITQWKAPDCISLLALYSFESLKFNHAREFGGRRKTYKLQAC